MKGNQSESSVVGESENGNEVVGESKGLNNGCTFSTMR